MCNTRQSHLQSMSISGPWLAAGGRAQSASEGRGGIAGDATTRRDMHMSIMSISMLRAPARPHVMAHSPVAGERGAFWKAFSASVQPMRTRVRARVWGWACGAGQERPQMTL